ncbi:MAG: AAA family ATPase [Planctomycetes bacterium]|nr:AAA family ATPase [Planctomycetota bacterium]
MRLAKLSLNGFKSFADPTDFSFDEPMIGVVGPNGCGKSNIVDAIKWVLGERSSKSLRGKEMIDVIFAGSASRKPSGMASVTLTFENPILGVREDATGGVSEHDSVPSAASDPGQPTRSDESASEASVLLASRNGRIHRGLPIDTDHVEVERRLYRDGTSQYLINGKRARLRDIRELFLDTGIGADAYSIIEQGKVDAMLLASPQERRTIFEEAAGIARYKQRRIESERKLQRADANLAVTREQLAGTERRLRTVKGQAAKARKFVALDSELRALRTALSFDQYEDLRERLNGLTSQLADLQLRRAETVESLSRAEQRKQDAELDRHELHGEHRRVEEERIAATHAAESAEQRKHLTERALEETRHQIGTDTQRLDEIQQKLDEIRRAIARQTEAIRHHESTLAQADSMLDRVGAERAGFLEAIADYRADLGNRRASSLNIEREQSALLTSVLADEKRAESLREQMVGVDRKQSRITTDRLELSRRVAEHELSASRHEAAIEQLDRELAERDRQAAMLSEGRRNIAGRVSDLEQRHLRLDGRRQTLDEMVSSGVGLGDGVLHVLGYGTQTRTSRA